MFSSLCVDRYYDSPLKWTSATFQLTHSLIILSFSAVCSDLPAVSLAKTSAMQIKMQY
jgi:hypothetical protein